MESHSSIFRFLLIFCLIIIVAASIKFGEAFRARAIQKIPWNTHSFVIPLLDGSFFDRGTRDAKETAKISSQQMQTADGITAKAYLVGNVATKEVYLKRNESRALPVASMSKLVTAFAATDQYKPDIVITIASSSLQVPPDGSNLRLDGKYTLAELLPPLLLSSSNVAAEAIASAKRGCAHRRRD